MVLSFLHNVRIPLKLCHITTFGKSSLKNKSTRGNSFKIVNFTNKIMEIPQKLKEKSKTREISSNN